MESPGTITRSKEGNYLDARRRTRVWEKLQSLEEQKLDCFYKTFTGKELGL